MNNLSNEVVLEFCNVCNWTYEIWIAHQTIANHSEIKLIMAGKCRGMLNRHSIMSKEYFFQQIAKLHDPMKNGKNENLSLEYIIECGAWNEELKKKLNILNTSLSRFFSHASLKDMRNKLLSHHDVKTLLSR